MEQYKYNPFPSLNPSIVNNINNGLAQKPPLPYTDKDKSSNKNNALIESKINENNINKVIGYQQQNQVDNKTNSTFNPFPSLNSVKNTPDFYKNQSLINEKYRKTRLW